MRQTRQYSDEFKEQIIRECQEVGNVSVVSRRHDISANTIHTWIKKYRECGTVKAMNESSASVEQQALKQLQKVSTENDRLKRLVAEKELELAILRDLRDRVNPK
ncbi:transposase [Anoxynatronum sibiricum]|uniref:Transposase n=1 Tax=Anoxynatronum sibiricum TaxID=210623 RepID=A0ABU9VRV2_9CLOT